MPQNAEPIFTDGKVVIYTVSNEAHSYEESFVCDVFYYNITDKKTIQIKKSFNRMITGNPAYIDDKLYGSLYLPNNETGVYQIDLSEFTSDVTYIWPESVIFETFYNINNKLVFHCAVPYEDGLTYYRIGIIDTEATTTDIIAETACNADNPKGTVIACMTVYDELIYALTEKYDGEKKKVQLHYITWQEIF